MSLENYYPGKRSKLKTALVLAGGGFRGAIECGVLKVLLKKIVPDVVVGTSAGAVNGAAVALGMPLEDIENYWRKVKKKSLFSFNYRLLYQLHMTRSIYSNKAFKNWIGELFPNKSFKDCKVPLYVNATRLKDGKGTFFSKGNLYAALTASCAIPPFLPPYTVDGVRYVDGGLSDYLGTDEVLKLGCKQVIIVTTGYSAKQEHYDKNIFDLMHHTVELVSFQAMHKEFQICEMESKHENLVEINPKKSFNYSLMDDSHIPEMISEGERDAKRMLRRIKM